MNTLALEDFLTDEEIEIVLAHKGQPHFHKHVVIEVLSPVHPRINEKFGQEMNLDYVAYLIEYLLTGR